MDDAATIKYSIFDFATLTTAATAIFSDGQPINSVASGSASKSGTWAIKFYDAYGEDWVTGPISAGATCNAVLAALEAIPNNVIPVGMTYCTLTSKVNSVDNTGWQSVTDSSKNDVGTAQNTLSESGMNHPYLISYRMAIWDAYQSVSTLQMGDSDPYSPLIYYGSSFDYGSNVDGTGHKSLSGYIYRIKFYGNPGALKQPEIVTRLDGNRNTLMSVTYDGTGQVTAATQYQVITKVWTDGQQGENNDYFADHCDGVTVTIGRGGKMLAGFPTAAPTVAPSVAGGLSSGTTEFEGNTNVGLSTYLTGFTATEKNLLKKCLGSADFDTSNNQDVYNWDVGTILYPHIIKLVRTVTTYTDGGYYAAIWYDTSTNKPFDNLGSVGYANDLSTGCILAGTDGTFRLLNPFSPPDAFATDTYEIYTTQGTLAMVSNNSQAIFGFGSRNQYMTNASYDMETTQQFDGDVSCEVGNHNAYKMKYIFHCLNVTDMITFLNWDQPAANPPHINLYTVQRLYQKHWQWSVRQRFAIGFQPDLTKSMHFMTHMITTDLATNWGVSLSSSVTPAVTGIQYPTHVYKFFPAAASTYNYVAPCANRGICDTDTGLCTCFAGYTNDDCHVQSSLAL